MECGGVQERKTKRKEIKEIYAVSRHTQENIPYKKKGIQPVSGRLERWRAAAAQCICPFNIYWTLQSPNQTLTSRFRHHPCAKTSQIK